MTTTTTVPNQTETTSWNRIAGVSALTFAVLVGVTNLVVSNLPAWDAGGEELKSWVHDHHVALAFTVAPFAITSVALVMFGAGFWNRARRSGDETTGLFATVGVLGMTMIAALFGVVETARLCLLALNGTSADPSLFEFAWHIEAGAFMLNTVAVAIAMFGVAGAAVRMGLAPSWYKPLSIVGLLCGVAAALQAPTVFNGTNGWQVGLVPFLAWLLLLLITGTRMARQN